LSRLRITLVFEEVSDTGDRVLSEQSYGAFVREVHGKADVESMSGILANTVKQELPKFWKLAK